MILSIISVPEVKVECKEFKVNEALPYSLNYIDIHKYISLITFVVMIVVSFYSYYQSLNMASIMVNWLAFVQIATFILKIILCPLLMLLEREKEKEGPSGPVNKKL
jgi:hypothetical protein